MGTLVVGDLHGKLAVVKQALATSHNVVFVGDYVDSYTESVELQIQTLDAVLDAIENEGDRVTGLIGNHEVSYLTPHMRCSGFNSATNMHLMTRSSRMMNTLKYYTRVDGFLISHAGVSQRFLTCAGLDTVEEYIDSNNYDQIGVYRGGLSPVGGLFWCDWRFDFAPIENLPQVVGHTRGQNIRRNGNSYCVDVLDYTPHCLLIQDGVVSAWNLNEGMVDTQLNIVEEET